MSGQYIANLRDVSRGAWARLGGSICYINHDASHRSNDCYVGAIEPGGELAAERHLFEETIFILEGRGATRVWNHRGDERTFEWYPGALFAIPLNTWHQHYNLDGHRSAVLLAVTTAPSILNTFGEADFVFGSEYDFTSRFDSQSEFGQDGALTGQVWESNFVADVRKFPLLDNHGRGAGSTSVKFKLAGNTGWAHVSEFPIGTYKKAHRHGPGAHVVILGGQGYSLMWGDGEQPKKYDWQDGTLIIPPDQRFHQHFNTGRDPARYLALRFTESSRDAQGRRPADISTREGGGQIDYRDEDPEIREMYRKALKDTGAEFRMDQVYADEALA